METTKRCVRRRGREDHGGGVVNSDVEAITLQHDWNALCVCVDVIYRSNSSKKKWFDYSQVSPHTHKHTYKRMTVYAVNSWIEARKKIEFPTRVCVCDSFVFVWLFARARLLWARSELSSKIRGAQLNCISGAMCDFISMPASKIAAGVWNLRWIFNKSMALATNAILTCNCLLLLFPFTSIVY